MKFFSSLFGEKTVKLEPKAKNVAKKLTEEERIAKEVGVVLHTVTMPNFSVSQLSDFFDLFHSLLVNVQSVDDRLACIKKTRECCGKLLLSRDEVRSIFTEQFLPSFNIRELFEGLLAEPLPLRARHVLALHRFCVTLDKQLYCRKVLAESNLVVRAENANPVTLALSPFLFPSSESININPCPGLNLRKIYRKLLEGDPCYLPTVEEYNAIIVRASELLRKEKNVVEVHLPAVVVGDIHGQMNDLLYHILPEGGPLVADAVLKAYRPDLPCFSSSVTHSHSHHRHFSGSASCSSFPKEGRARLSSPTHPHGFNASMNHTEGIKSGSIHSTPFSSSHTKHMQKFTAPQHERSTSRGASTSCESKKEERPVTYLFLGDFVDRGKNSLQCLCLLYVAKILSPNTIFLLRGNHECRFTNRGYGFLSECHTVYPIKENKVTSKPVFPSNALTSPTWNNKFPNSSEEEGEGSVSSSSVLPLPSILDISGEDEEKEEGPSLEGFQEENRWMTSPSRDVVDHDLPQFLVQKKEEQNKEAEQDKVLSLNDIFPDLPDHPLWTSANDSFNCLPIAAVLIRNAAEEENPNNSKNAFPSQVGSGDPVCSAHVKVGLPVSETIPTTGGTSGTTTSVPSNGHQDPKAISFQPVKELTLDSAFIEFKGPEVTTSGAKRECHSPTKQLVPTTTKTLISSSHHREGGSSKDPRHTIFASSWSSLPTEESRTKKTVKSGPRASSVTRSKPDATSVFAVPSSSSTCTSNGSSVKPTGFSLETVPTTSTTAGASATPASTSAASAKPEIVIIAMHGGISPNIENSLDGILAIDRFENISAGPLADITWSDPFWSASEIETKNPSLDELKKMAKSSLNAFPTTAVSTAEKDVAQCTAKDFKKPAEYVGPDIGFVPSPRGTGYNFGEDATCKFVNTNKIYFIVRAHQCVKEGFFWCHSNRVLTVFSAANYCDLGNKGAVLLLDAHGNPTTKSYSAMNLSTTFWPEPHPPKFFS